MYPIIELLRHAQVQISGHDIVNTRDLRTRRQRYPDWTFVYIKRGTLRCRLRGVDHRAVAGDAFLIPPQTAAEIIKDDTNLTTCLWWHAKYTIGGSADVLRLFQLPPLLHVTDRARLESAFSRYVSSAERPGTVTDAIMEEARSYELMAVVLDEALRQTHARLNSRALAPFSRIMLEIVEHCESDISLADLSERYNMHPTYISNQFTRAFGTSPIKLHLDARLSKAKQLLLDDTLTIGEVGELVGYEDLTQFSRFFRRRTGVSPREYRAGRSPVQTGTTE